MYTMIFITICGLIIVLSFEIRHREILEELVDLHSRTGELEEEIIALKKEIKLKKDVFEENKG